MRIIDANANRASEGLRVVEEHARFVLDDSYLTSQWKQLRHDLVTSLAAIPFEDRHLARDTLADVGTELAASDEYRRTSLCQIVSANQKRVEQSLRCLEEYSKPLCPDLASQLESLRYQAYTLSRAQGIAAASREHLDHVRLYVLIDGQSSIEVFSELVELLVGAGVHALQLRDKSLADRELLERARLLRRHTRTTHTLFFMNDRPDLAVLADADGVHLGQEDLAIKDARSIVGTEKIVGVSTHSLQQARQAMLEGANYIGCGPTFPSTTKTFASFPGIEFLRQVSREISLPAFAIGGITQQNVGQVLETGFERVAVSGAVTQADEPAILAKRLLACLEQDSESIRAAATARNANVESTDTSG